MMKKIDMRLLQQLYLLSNNLFYLNRNPPQDSPSD